jgi:hypothetical protein
LLVEQIGVVAVLSVNTAGKWLKTSRFAAILRNHFKVDYTCGQSLSWLQKNVIYHSWPVGLVLKSAAVYVYLVKSG